MPKTNRHVLLGITGGVAAYKSLSLIRLLRERNMSVRVCLTPAAQAFVTPLSCQALSGQKVYTNLFEAEASDDGMHHIALAKWADMLIIAPATADAIARLAHGHANDLLGNVVLAYNGPLLLAPAMNQQMWLHPATQANLQQLRERHIIVMGPDEGEQACGDMGPGRMLEPEAIMDHIDTMQTAGATLDGQRVLITAGPTQEAIDPVRYLSNQSSGKMGYALATVAAQLGADVTLISGPTMLKRPNGSDRVSVTSGRDMHTAVMQRLHATDIFIGCAAVADYRPSNYLTQKMKKHADTWQLDCVKNPDILHDVCQHADKPFVVGFAAETESVLTNAMLKQQRKGCDMMVANAVGYCKGFNEDVHTVSLIDHHGDVTTLPEANKNRLALAIWQHIAYAMRELA